MKVHSFVAAVASMRFENAFNPYSDRCEIYDRKDAPQRRACALSAIIERAADAGVDSVWVGRDLGYRGGRRTGLALTDDSHISRHAGRWGVRVERSTIGEAIVERTASVIWGALDQIDEPVFLWNVFPLHPHEAGRPFTNRRHNSAERLAGEEILSLLLRLLRPHRIVAVGNDALCAALRVGGRLPVFSVRHPSYGGQREFERQVAELYGLHEGNRHHRAQSLVAADAH